MNPSKRKYHLQIKEIKFKVILNNLSRMISIFLFLILIKEFYRALILIVKTIKNVKRIINIVYIFMNLIIIE